MNSQTIVMCVVALLLGMLLANMLKSVCGCKVVEGQPFCVYDGPSWTTSTFLTCVPGMGKSESVCRNLGSDCRYFQTLDDLATYYGGVTQAQAVIDRSG